MADMIPAEPPVMGGAVPGGGGGGIRVGGGADGMSLVTASLYGNFKAEGGGGGGKRGPHTATQSAAAPQLQLVYSNRTVFLPKRANGSCLVKRLITPRG